ncbi:Aste57867_19533 [Aphanomyces stellatus]|uniref:Aste57867_19533 protein n=1 Tax=Aphanomyces stellatus TaxID=120398 RepID=A0A485LE32_9STRA|nr:hypothetical protein As57867_019469 [Aphanomyces stellatus]VFT96240.1 Aste57867_19533 [Aphanomyces stellatus]
MDARRHEERAPLVINQPVTTGAINDGRYGSAPDELSVAVKIAGGIDAADDTQRTGHLHYDYVIAFPHDAPASASISKQDIVNRLHLAGLTTDEVLGTAAIFCKIRADIPRLQKEAARVKLPVLLDESTLGETAKTGLQAFHIDSFEVENPPRTWIDMFKRPVYAPYACIFMPYAKEIDQTLYASHDDGTFFSSIHRMQLIESILTNVHGGGAGLDLELLQSDGVLLACYPLHHARQKAALAKKWMAWCYAPWSQPLQDIRNYFGPKLALYFGVVGHFATYTLWASLLGLVVFAMQLAPANSLAMYIHPTALTYVMPLFGMAMLLWASFFLKHWKRRNAVLAKEWGMSDFDKRNKDVPMFHHRPDTFVVALARVGGSWLVVACLAGLILAGVVVLAGLYDLPGWLQHNATVVAAAIVAQVVALSLVFQWLVVALNDYENHATEAAYEASFVAKMVVFELVNRFAALAYFAFFVPMHATEFAWLVYRVYGASIVLDLVARFLGRAATAAPDAAVEDMDAQYALAEYDWKQSMLDHHHLVLHFASITLFATLCPLNPCLAFVHYSLQLRANGAKLLHRCRRPRPRGAETIGAWYLVMHWVLNVAIVTNAWLMVSLYPNQTLKGTPDVTTTTVAPSLVPTTFVVTSQQIVLSLILVIVVCRVVISVGYQDTPSRIRLQLERQAYYVAKLYYKAFGWPVHADLSKDKDAQLFEFCLAFPNPEGLTNALDKSAMANVLDTLKMANVQYKVYPSAAKASPYLSSYIFCEIRATEAQLQQEAARIQLPMLLDEIMLKEKAHEGVFQALYVGMVDVVDRMRIEATRVNLMLLVENMLTQPVFLNTDYSNAEMADKLEKLLAAIEGREPRAGLALARVLSEFKDLVDVDIEGEQFRALDIPQTLFNRIETYLKTGEASSDHKLLKMDSSSTKEINHSANKHFNMLVDEMVDRLHQKPLDSLYAAQRQWQFGLEKVLWFVEEVIKQSNVSVFELKTPDASLKWLTIQAYLQSFDTEVLYPKLNNLLVEAMMLLQAQGSTPYKAFQEFRAKHPQSKVLDLVTALEALIVSNPDVEITPFYLGNPDPKYNLLAKRFKYRPYQYLHMPFRRQLGAWQEVYATPSADSAFTPVQRMTLIESMLQRLVNVDWLVAQHVLTGAYPLHDVVEQEQLKKEWISWTLAQPLDHIRDYFGDNVGMYFALLSHGTKWLILATVVGVVFFVWQTIYSFGDLERIYVPAFGVFMILWATLWLKHWTRAQSILKMQWGLYTALDGARRHRSPVRAAYTGDFIRNPITGQKMKYFQKNARLVRWVLGWLVLGAFLAVALGGQALVFYIALRHTTVAYVSLGTALVQALWILTMKIVYNHCSVWLIEYENHRTEASYEVAYVLKAGVFHGLNSFAALLFLLKDPSLRNKNSLYVVYAVELLATHLASIGRLVLHSKGETAEMQFFQADYSYTKSMEKHLDLVIHFGYMIGGVVVCPLTPALAFLDHVLAMRLQATQLLQSTRRPRPRKMTNPWYVTMMHVVLVCAIVSNSYLVVFVVKTFGPVSVFSTVDGFCSILLGLVVARQFLNMVFNDVPTRVDSQLERQQFVVDSILREQPGAAAVVPAAAVLRPTTTSAQSDFSSVYQDDEEDVVDEVEEEGFV